MDYFMHFNIDAGSVGIIDGKGIHLLKAMHLSGTKNTFFLTELMLQIVYLNDVIITESDLNSLPMKEVNYITTCINTMLEDNNLRI